MVELLVLLFTKHLVADFFLQTPFQWKNKGTYGHPGGILHAGIHGIGTMLAVLLMGAYAPVAIACALLDSVVHYHIDWFKMNWNAQEGYKADTHEQFWWLLGADQYLHNLTYIAIAAVIA